ncbi:hypothetical protein [Culicoidibacter larvae]|uniref:Uncharacterized protein n=1 Tax=Culicoidibacter larvae TaxID=2579976 RepID=A0A5R8Q8Q1_9FIRM|nr:hypothetical protein [Culicoidibacter larvae]TLG72088.1 hypothetical protein FEZ08_09655 [Culicoidibacter larvae]
MSKVYIITYDLNAPGQKYNEVIETIKTTLSTGVWCSFWKSSYVFRSNLTPTEMMSCLNPLLDSDDRVFICELNENYNGSLPSEGWDYIKQSIFH